MQNRSDIQKKYAKLKEYLDEAGPFFRQKTHYSDDERIAFIVDFYANYMGLLRIFEEDEELMEGRGVTIGIGKTLLTKKLLEQEFDAAVSVIYFNLSTPEILALEERTKTKGSPKEALILRRLFEKYLSV
jgi:hypothetical protein